MSLAIEHSMKFRVVMMTPAWAQELLNQNHPNNRRPKKGRIESYARDMQQGYWELTAEPICVDVKGFLTNGQNRLSAVIRASVEVPMTLVTGCPVKAIRGQDQGATRNVADIAVISGTPLPHGATNFAGIVRAMHQGLTNRKMTNHEVLDFAKQHNDAIEFVFECFGTDTAKGITLSPVKAVIARSYYKRNLRSRTKEFCEVLLTGLPNNPQEDAGAIRLRNWLIETQLGGARGHVRHRPKPMVIYAKTERALAHFHSREYIDRLIELSKELFPLPNNGDEAEPIETCSNGVLVH